MSAPTHIQRCRQWIEEQLESMGTLRTANSRDLSFKSWRQNTVTVIQRIWPNDRERVERFRRITFTPPQARPDPKLTRDWFGRGIAESRTYLQSLLDSIDQEGVPVPADADRDRGGKELEDEVGFPMLDLSESGAVHLPSPSSGPAVSVVGDLDVTPGYTTPDEQGAVPREPVSPLPPSLQMQWRMPAAFGAKNPAGPAAPAPPALGEPNAGDAAPREREERPEVEIPRAPSLPPAEKPAAKAAEPPAETPAAPVAAKAAQPVAEKPAAPVAAKAAPPVAEKPAAPVAAKPVPPVAEKPAAPVAAKPAPPVAAKPVAPVTPLTPAPPKAAPPAVAKPAEPFFARPAAPAPATPAPAHPVAARAAEPAAPVTPAPEHGRVETTSSPRRESPARAKAGKQKPKKAGPKPKLKDLLGFDEFEAKTHEAEAALSHLTPPAAPPPAEAVSPAAEAAPHAAPPPAAPPPAEVAPPASQPVAATAPAEPPAAVDADEDTEEHRERATLDFMQNSPVFGVVGKPVQRRTDTTDFLDPDAVAVATLAVDLGRLGVPEGMKSSLGARLLDVAAHLECGEIEWALLRGTVTDAMQYPDLARRLLPVLLPWLERAA